MMMIMCGFRVFFFFFLLFADSIRGKKRENDSRHTRLFNSHPCMRRCYFFARPMSAEVVDDVRVCLSISILFCLQNIRYHLLHSKTKPTRSGGVLPANISPPRALPDDRLNL